MKHQVTKLGAAAGKVLDRTMLYRSNKPQPQRYHYGRARGDPAQLLPMAEDKR
jgi:hypothetical protein